MAQFSQLITTKQGQILIAKMLSGTNGIKFTRIITSSTRYEINQLEDLTELNDTKQSVLVSKVSRPSEITVQVEAAVKNDEITIGYYLRSVGLYAIDPDVGEVLFAVTIETSGNCYMPAYNGVAVSGAYIKLIARVSNSEIVNLEVDPAGVATVGDIMNKLDFDSDISETVIETLDTVEDRYPVPVAGETMKVFAGKVQAFFENAKPLEADTSYYVSASEGSDTTGDGSESSPYASITKALSVIPKDFGGFTTTIFVADGTYDENVTVNGYQNGYLTLRRQGNLELNSLCNINKITITYCDSVSVAGFNCNADNNTGVFVDRCKFVNVSYCQAISTATGFPSFSFDYTSNVRITNCRSINHQFCLRTYSSHVYSEGWSADSVGIQYGIYAIGGGQIAKGNSHQPKGNAADTYYASGSIITSLFGANIGTLRYDLTLYVATTGSDTTGDGTSGNPFRTIQHAINIIPKDLGGYTANVIIAGGTYDEDVHIAGLYPGTGRIMVYLSGNVVVRGFTVNGSHVIISSYDSVLHNLTAQYVLVQDIATLNMWAQINLTTTGYIVDPLTTTSRISIIVTRNSALYLSGITTITGNDAVGVFVGNMSQVYIATITGSGFTVGIYSVTGSRVSIVSNLISAITPYAQTGGGIFTYGNGTQISGIISSGLSCTWGTIRGGYIRHGNAAGTAMVTVQLNVLITSQLSAGTQYNVLGFPSPSTGYDLSVAINRPTICDHCFMGWNGQMHFIPTQTITTGNAMLFNVTYLTNS